MLILGHVLITAFVGIFCYLAMRCILVFAHSLNYRKQSQRSIGINNTSNADSLLRNGVRIFITPAKVLLKSEAIKNYMRRAVIICETYGKQTSPEALLSIALALCCLIFVICSVLFSSLATGALCACLPLPFFVWSVGSREKKIEESIREDIPAVINCFERCASSGLTLQQTLEEASKDSNDSLKQLFMNCTALLKTGGSATQALQLLHNQAPVDELKILCIALQIQHQAGGSLSQVLHSASITARNKIALQKQLKVQTAQAKLSAQIVTILPFVLLAALSIISPGFIDPFFQSPIGFAMLALALLLQAAGIILTSHIVKGPQK